MKGISAVLVFAGVLIGCSDATQFKNVTGMTPSAFKKMVCARGARLPDGQASAFGGGNRRVPLDKVG